MEILFQPAPGTDAAAEVRRRLGPGWKTQWKGQVLHARKGISSIVLRPGSTPGHARVTVQPAIALLGAIVCFSLAASIGRATGHAGALDGAVAGAIGGAVGGLVG